MVANSRSGLIIDTILMIDSVWAYGVYSIYDLMVPYLSGVPLGVGVPLVHQLQRQYHRAQY